MKAFVFGLATFFVAVVHAVPGNRISDNIPSIVRHHVRIRTYAYGDYDQSDISNVIEIGNGAIHAGLKEPWEITSYFGEEMRKRYPNSNMVISTESPRSNLWGWDFGIIGKYKWMIEAKLSHGNKVDVFVFC